MKNMYYLILLLIVCTGCKNTAQHENQKETSAEAADTVRWKIQFNTIKEEPANLLVVSGISLVDYQLVDVIDNEQKLEKYKTVLKEEQDMLPYYNQSLDTIKVVTKKEAQNIKSEHQEFTFDKQNGFIDECVREGMKIIRLTWDNNGTKINTLCVVSDEIGIVYDCFLINTMIVTRKSAILEKEEYIITR